MINVNEIFDVFMNNRTLKLVMLFICLDTFLGLLRAFKAHEFNSSVGIDGAIRKVAMLVSVALLLLADHIVQVNLLSCVPGNVTDALGIHKIGMSELFGLLYVIYESVSIMKNMVLLGLPIPGKLKGCMEVFLSEMTTELETSGGGKT